MATTITSSDANALTLDELVPILKRCIKVQRPSFLWAGPGIGKSSIVAALAKELGGISIDMRLSQMQPTDIMDVTMISPASPAFAINSVGHFCWMTRIVGFFIASSASITSMKLRRPV